MAVSIQKAPVPTDEQERRTFAHELQTFTQAFFSYFGAPPVPVANAPDLLQVDLTEALAAHFDRETLTLRFHQSNRPDTELVAFGSRIFDRMIAFLEQRGALTVLTLPKRHAGGEELLRAIHPANAAITGLNMSEEMTPLFAFNWHITYRADDKREELLTILLDADGDYVETLGEFDEQAATFETLLRAADLIPAGEGEAQTSKLPPMTQLRRLAETARKYAIYHADLQCIAHEAEVLPRLHKTLSRLKTYYDQQIEEVYDTHDFDGEKRRSLELDMARKIDEEVENHRLRVRVHLSSYAIVERPTARAAITLSDGQQSATVHVARDLFDGTLSQPACHACGRERRVIALDRNGHITCDACLRQCDACQAIVCATCGVSVCPVCEANNCEACSVECWACGERACQAHVDRCPLCGDVICHACLSDCAACGRRLCRSHLRAETVVADGESAPLICPECAVRCPGCQQYSARLGVCSASGQRFCRNCLVICTQCGDQVGSGFYVTHPRTGDPHCRRCAVTCTGCGAAVAEQETCAGCGAPCCHHCGPLCQSCGRRFCRDHAIVLPTCGHIVCAAHQAVCCIGHEPVCPICRPPCPVCERPYCQEHARACDRCRRSLCTECVQISGLCDTCARHDRDGELISLMDEPCAQDERVAHLLPRFRWMRVRDARHTLYLGRDRQMSAVIIVVEEDPDGPSVILARRLGTLDTRYRERWF